jgi:hypothetical protein
MKACAVIVTIVQLTDKDMHKYATFEKKSHMLKNPLTFSQSKGEIKNIVTYKLLNEYAFFVIFLSEQKDSLLCFHFLISFKSLRFLFPHCGNRTPIS